jgi:hypothetical protein
MPGPEENPAGPLAQKSPFKPVDPDQFQISTRRLRVPVNPLPIFLVDFPANAGKFLPNRMNLTARNGSMRGRDLLLLA